MKRVHLEDIDLMLDNGEIVRIQVANRYLDECLESIENAMKRGDWWSSSRFDPCRMTYRGIFMDRVNMGRVVGML